MRAMRFVLGLLFALGPPLPAGSATGAESHWGALQTGTQRVGFRLIEETDNSRICRRDTDGLGQALTGDRGRPIRLYLWYPAHASGDTTRMRFGRYAELMDGDYWPRVTGAEAGERGPFATSSLARSLPEARLKTLLEAPTFAAEDAESAEGSYPLIVFGQGLYYESPITHAILCEFLASHGYVVATCPLIGTSSRLVNLDVRDLETQVRDMEFVIARAREHPCASKDDLGLVGFDLGGMSALILAMRNPDVDALVSLDAGILFTHGSGLPLASPHYDVTRFRMPWLHATRAEAGIAPAGFDAGASLFETAVYSERYLVLVDEVRHTDFTSFALIAEREPVPAYWGPTQGDPKASYRAVCRYVLNFFDAYLKDGKAGRDFLTRPPAEAVPGVPLTIAHRPSVAGSPSVGEFVNAVREHGIERTLDWVRGMTSNPRCDLLQEDVLNRLGYQFLYFWGQTEEAVAIFELNAELHPESANVYDSLGEGYLFKGEREQAVGNYRKSLQLDPSNENAKGMLRRLGEDEPD